MRFAELSDAERMDALRGLDSIGSECHGYHGDCITVAVPRGEYHRVAEWAERFGLEYRSMYYFPLGSDKPREHLRNDGPPQYDRGNRGFWLFADFAPAKRDAEKTA